MPITDRASEYLRRYRLDDDRPNQETSIERLMRQAFDLAGLEYETQGHVGRYRPDFIVHFGASRVVVECDGPHHRQPAQIVKDRRKDAAYAASGLRVYRFTDTEIRKSAVACVDLIVARERLIHDPESVFKPAAPAAENDASGAVH
jgi:very-short-patch-repair endonuclease